MKHKIIIVLLTLFYSNSITSQVIINFHSINEYMFKTKEALNFTAINSSLKSVEVNFYGKITNQDGESIVEFKTESFVLNPGSNFITPMTISMRDVNYYINDIAEIEEKTGTYPSGNYFICVWTNCANHDCNGSGAEIGRTEQPVCVKMHIENPTPLLLSYPEENSEIIETRPIYTWIPPGPIASSSELNYLMRLVEVNEGQTPSDALLINRPLIEIEGLAQNSMMHPNDIASLEPGNTYAWQIQAFIGKTYFAKSEQWKFKVKKEVVVKDTIKYIKVVGGFDAAEYSVSEDGYLYFVFKDQKPNYTLDCKLLDSKMKSVQVAVFEQGNYDTVLRKEVFSSVITYSGENKYRVNAGLLKLPSGFYFIEIISSRKDKLYIKFKID